MAACTSALLIAAQVAQSEPPDFSGRWRLIEPTAGELAMETLPISAADELLIEQTPLAITVAHPSQHGTHPEAGVFRYGGRGIVGGIHPTVS